MSPYDPAPPSRDEVLKRLGRASLTGGLGLLIGTGFSIAATEDSPKPALSWGELLECAAAELDLEFPPADSQGMSYPRMASEMARVLREKILEDAGKDAPTGSRRTALDEATSRIKEKIARLTAFHQNPELSDDLGEALKGIGPAWIVTTNFDLLIEELLPDSDVLLPRQVIPANARVTPVYHLHGHRLAPASIVITEQDYVETFRMGEYRQIKLSLLFSESTTLLLGYGLGDVNVLTAIEWARSYSSNGGTAGGSSVGSVIQTLWDPDGGEQEPYWGDHDELIVPIDGLTTFLREIVDARDALERDDAQVRALVKELESPKSRKQFLASRATREKYLAALVEYSARHGSRKPLELLDEILEPEDSWSWADFGTIHLILEATLDIFEHWAEQDVHPALFNAVAGKLGNLSWYIGEDPKTELPGDAWKAQKVWHKRKRALPRTTIRKLRRYAEENDYSKLVRLLDPIGSE